MNIARAYLDTDAVSELARHPRAPDIRDACRQFRVEVIISETLVTEVLLTEDPSRRRQITATVLRLLASRCILSSWVDQVRHSSIDFVAGSPRFVPCKSEAEAHLRQLLINPDSLDSKTLEEMNLAWQAADNKWDEMHARARPAFQEQLLNINEQVPMVQEWLTLKSGGFAEEVVREILPDFSRRHFSTPILTFMQWNPLLRAFMEQFLLAVRRHALEPWNAASKKGPKWPDYSHGAFAALVDVFVSNDARFRNALSQHSRFGSIGEFHVMDLNAFVNNLLSGVSFPAKRAADFSWRKVQTSFGDLEPETLRG